MAVILVAIIIGLLVGSALTALIHRALRGGNWLAGRSHCPRCNHVLMPKDLVPLFSYLVLHGKCRYCEGAIGWLYPLVEGSTALLFAGAVLARVGGVPTEAVFDEPLLQYMVLRDWLVIAALIAIFATDAIASVIPDAISIPAIVLVVLANLLVGDITPASMGIAALVGAGFFGVQYWISRGRWIGAGDIRLGALVGAALGWPAVLAALFVAYLFGATAGGVLVAAGAKTWKSQVPFGTFLTIGAAAILLAGEPLMNWYVQLLTPM